MTLTQSQIEHCKQIEAKGGPDTLEEIELYQQYVKEKNRIEKTMKTTDMSVDAALARAAHGMNQLEKELSDLEGELSERQTRLDSLLKDVDSMDKKEN